MTLLEERAQLIERLLLYVPPKKRRDARLVLLDTTTETLRQMLNAEHLALIERNKRHARTAVRAYRRQST